MFSLMLDNLNKTHFLLSLNDHSIVFPYHILKYVFSFQILKSFHLLETRQLTVISEHLFTLNSLDTFKGDPNCNGVTLYSVEFLDRPL